MNANDEDNELEYEYLQKSTDTIEQVLLNHYEEQDSSNRITPQAIDENMDIVIREKEVSQKRKLVSRMFGTIHSNSMRLAIFTFVALTLNVSVFSLPKAFSWFG